MKNIDFAKFCTEANGICKDCRVMHVCPERDHDGESNSSTSEKDFDHKGT